MKKILELIGKYSEFALAAGVIFILLVMLFPVPTSVLDILLAFSVTAAIIILMTTLFIEKPLDLSIFPTILLVTTILRLSLNIASTRLILANGHNGASAAGNIIEAFGHFVMQGNVVIGLIVFIILTIINFIVITKGSGRIAEVAARFSLDAMPGKQMAIDADLGAGMIDEKEAKERRKILEDENTFFGAMDGANKFVRGDAIAGIIITFINLVGGIIIGIIQRDMNLDSAIKTYSILTIGDGLVSQIPSLIISLAAGLLVTKSGVSGSADKAIFNQFSKYPQALFMTSLVCLLFSTLPGLPFTPFMTLSLMCAGSAFVIYRLRSQEKTKTTKSKTGNNTNVNSKSESSESLEGKTEEKPEDALVMDPIRVELGYNLLQLVNYTKGQKLTDQIKALRTQIAKDFGFLMPSIRIQDNLQLDYNEYAVKIKEIDCGGGEIRIDKLLIMDPKGEKLKVPGEDTNEPAFGLPARWIDENRREEAIFNEYTVVDPPTILTTHLTEIVKENITELLSYTEVQKLIEEVEDNHKKLIKDVVPDPVSISALQKILQSLLSEGISIRDLATIIEAASDSLKLTKNITDVTEFVRVRLSRQICFRSQSKDGFISVITLSPEWEKEFSESIGDDNGDKHLNMAPSKLQDFTGKLRRIYDQQATKGVIPVLLTSSTVRPFVRAVIERFRSSIIVLSQNEIHQKAKIRTLGTL